MPGEGPCVSLQTLPPQTGLALQYAPRLDAAWRGPPAFMPLRACRKVPHRAFGAVRDDILRKGLRRRGRQMNWRLVRWAGAILAVFAWPGVVTAATPLEIRVVVVTTFEVGNDTGDQPGEFQNWVERYPLPEILPFPQGYRSLRYNPKDHVLGIVTGAGKASAAASIMALGLDPRFDLTKAYWILAGIAGIDPNRASVGSAVWASHIVDGDLAYEIDGREIPADWTTGIVAYDRATPFELPAPPAVSDNGTLAYELNGGLAAWPTD